MRHDSTTGCQRCAAVPHATTLTILLVLLAVAAVIAGTALTILPFVCGVAIGILYERHRL